MEMNCSKCGSKLKEGSIFCSNCGNKIEKLNKKEEEQSNINGAKCPKCGKELEQIGKSGLDCPNCRKNEEKKRKRNIIIASIIMLLIVPIITVGIIMSSTKPEGSLYNNSSKYKESNNKIGEDEILQFAVNYYNNGLKSGVAGRKIKKITNYKITIEETTNEYIWYFILLNYQALDNSNMVCGTQVIQNMKTNKLTGYNTNTDAKKAIQNKAY